MEDPKASSTGAALEAEVAAVLAERIPTGTPGAMPVPALLAVARHCIVEAGAYGFTEVADVAFFAHTMITVNPAFHRQPRIHEILSDSTIPLGERLGVALRHADDSSWEAAEHMTDAHTYWRAVLAAARRAALTGRR